MRRSIRLASGVLAALASFPMLGISQIIPSQLTHTFPFGPCGDVLPVADRTYLAAGGGIYVINTDVANPQLLTGLPNKLVSGGYTWQLGVSTNVLYAAAGKQGMTRFRRSDHLQLAPLAIPGEEIRTINIVEFGGLNDPNVAFVGTSVEDPGTGLVSGRLSLYRILNGGEGAIQLQAVVATPTRVTALASYKHSGGNKLTLLVGTACHTAAAGPAVVRYDFDITGDVAPSAIPASSGGWAALGPCGVAPGMETPQNTFVRDIEIDPLTDTAYVAAFSRGVHRVTLPSGGGVVDANHGATGWPIIDPCGVGERYVDVEFVQLAGGQKLLFVSRSDGSHEREWGICGQLEGCDDVIDARRAVDVSDVRLFDASSNPPVLLSTFNAKAVRATPRPGSAFPLFLDVAAGQAGLAVVRVNSTAMLAQGSYDKFDGVAVGSKAQIEQIGANYIVSQEIGISAFDATKAPTDPTLLQDQLAFSGNGGVLMSGYAQAAGLPSIVFTRTFNELHLYHVATGGPGGTATGITYMGPVPTEGRGYGVKAVPPSLTPNGRGWVVATNGVDFQSAMECPGQEIGRSGLRIWYVINNVENPGPEDLLLMGKYVSQVCQPDPAGTFFDCLVDYPGTGNSVSIWVSYGSRDSAEPTVGLAVFRGDVTYYQGRAWIDIQYVGKVPLCDSAHGPPCQSTALDGDVGLLTRDGSTIYAAFACNGIAAFSTAAPGALTFPGFFGHPSKRGMREDVRHGKTRATEVHT